MFDNRRWKEFSARFPALGEDARIRAELGDAALLRSVPAHDLLYRDGDECTHLPLVLSGELLLTKHGESGRAITLYRVEAGESCILSALSILNSSAFPAEATTLTEVSLVLVPAATLKRLVAVSAGWRDFIFGMYHSRLAALISLVEEVVFGRLDVRLARALVRLAEGGPIRATHHELAAELGSSREVVSRLLKEWERRGILMLSRGNIAVRSERDLKEIADVRD